MKSVLITGANRGIGLELTRDRLAHGDSVIACTRDPDNGAALDGLHGAHRATMDRLTLNVVDAASVFALCSSVGERPIDVLVANAGIIGPERQSTLDMDYEGWADTFAVNTMGPLRVVQALLPNLRRAPHALVMIVSSQMGSMTSASSDRLAYRASKAAVNKVAQALASDFKPMGIAVIAVHPGWVRTDMGGAQAPLSPTESARGLSRLIDETGLERTGQFINVDGAQLGW